jgi:PAS domain S-box-containing protein
MNFGVQMDRVGEMRDVGFSSADAALGRAFAEIAPNASFVIYQLRVRPDGTYGFPIVSSGFQDLFGVQPGDVAARGGAALSRVHPDDRKTLLDGVLAAHETLEPWHGEFRVRSPHGEVWVEGRTSGRREPDGSTLWFGVLFDITERKRTEEALRVSERRFHAMFEVAPVGVAQADPATGRWVAVNPRMCAITGYSETELLTMRVLEITHPEDREHDWALFQNVVKGEAPEYRLEKRYIRKDGSIAWVNVNMVVLRDAAGQPTRTVAMIEDITDRKRTEANVVRLNAELQDALQWQRQIFEGSRDAVFLSDEGGRFVAVNGAATELTCFSREELLTMTIPDLHEDPDLGAYRAFHRRILDGEQILSEASIRRRDGGKVAVEFNNSLVVIGGRSFMHTAGRDVSERKKAAEALLASEYRYRVLFENAAEGIVAIDPETRRFQFFNPSACAMFGYTSEEFGKLSLSDLHPEEVLARVLNEIRAAVDGFRPKVAPGFPCRRKDGTPFLADVHGSVVTLAGRRIALGFFTDVTVRVRLEEQLRQAQKMEAIGQLAGGVAHDFNNLLTVISGNCELLLCGTPADDPRRGSLADIRSASERAASLTRQLLAFSRKQILEPRLVDVHEVVTGIEKMLRRLIGEDMDLQTDLAADPSWVKVDPGQLEQVVMNLVVNARDAMPRGGRITIRTRNAAPAASVDLEEAGEPERRPRVVIAISDTGSGIPPEVKPHLFEPFFTTKAPGKGTGLGLATVYGIVKQSGGDLVVESEPGKGATFTVALPSQDSPRRTRGASGSHRALPRGTETVLVVEDEDAVRRIVKIALETTGYRVIEARNGTEALEAARTHAGAIHMVVTDVVMPEMSGRELAERITKDFPGLRILYMSGYMDDAVVRHGIVEAGVAFLQKPFSPLALARKVREMLDSAD